MQYYSILTFKHFIGRFYLISKVWSKFCGLWKKEKRWELKEEGQFTGKKFIFSRLPKSPLERLFLWSFTIDWGHYFASILFNRGSFIIWWWLIKHGYHGQMNTAVVHKNGSMRKQPRTLIRYPFFRSYGYSILWCSLQIVSLGTTTKLCKTSPLQDGTSLKIDN